MTLRFLAGCFVLTVLSSPATCLASYGPQSELEDSTLETAADVSTTPAESPAAKLYDLRLGGALRFNGFHKSWAGEDANRDKFGDFDFDTFRMNVDGSYQGLDVSAEYRLYSGYNMLHHGYVAHTFANQTEIQVGVSRNPFGLLPYASHNWFFDII